MINLFVEFQRKVFVLLEGIRFDQKIIIREQAEQRKHIEMLLKATRGVTEIRGAVDADEATFGLPLQTIEQLQALVVELQDREKKDSLV